MWLIAYVAYPSTAQGYVFNATVVPTGGLGYLTLWPDGEGQPVVSTLNAVERSHHLPNMAIVPNVNGKTRRLRSGRHATHDGYFKLFCPPP